MTIEKKMTNAEVENLSARIGQVLRGHTPVKFALAKTLENMHPVLEAFYDERDKVFEKHAVPSKGEKGKFETKEGVEEAQSYNDFVYKDEKKFEKEFNALHEKEVSFELQMVDSDKPVFVAGRAVKLEEYLESTMDMPAAVALFIKEVFVHDKG